MQAGLRLHIILPQSPPHTVVVVVTVEVEIVVGVLSAVPLFSALQEVESLVVSEMRGFEMDGGADSMMKSKSKNIWVRDIAISLKVRYYVCLHIVNYFS